MDDALQQDIINNRYINTSDDDDEPLIFDQNYEDIAKFGENI